MGRQKKSPEPSNEMDVTRRANRQSTYLDKQGREMPNPTPIAPPLGYKKQPTLREQIRNMVLSEKLKQEAAAAGAETFEEADDFNVGDDFDPTSPYEEIFEPLPAADPTPHLTLADAIANSIAKRLGAPEIVPEQQPEKPAPPQAPATTTTNPATSGVPTPSSRLFGR